MKTYLKPVIYLLVALVVLGGAYALTKPAPQSAATPLPQTGTVTLSVQNLYTGKQVTISEGETVLQTLQAVNAEDSNMKLSTKTYSGLGVLVTGMGTSMNGTGQKYWQYKVNGVAPQIGADQYALKTGDSIEWLYAASQE